jgi:uncharacterized protein YggU (UPF0235/DUF167 family)
MTPATPWLRPGDGYLTIAVSARPASRKRGLLRCLPAGPVIGLLSAPEKGRANRELIEFMAETLDVPASTVSIARGQGARQKVVRVETSVPHELARKLAKLAGLP